MYLFFAWKLLISAHFNVKLFFKKQFLVIIRDYFLQNSYNRLFFHQLNCNLYFSNARSKSKQLPLRYLGFLRIKKEYQVKNMSRKPFKLRKLAYAAMLSVISSGYLSTQAFAATYHSVDTSNGEILIVGLNQSYLGDSLLGTATTPGNLGSLATGNYFYKYAAIVFTPTADGTYFFGQTQAPVDTVMILYDGVYDPTQPSLGALRGNDDTNQQLHRNALGDQSINTLCGTVNYCPQISYSVTAGVTYTLFVSLYNPSRNLDLPFEFYSTGDVVFGNYAAGRTPINQAKNHHLSTELHEGGSLDPIFVGGTLKMDHAEDVNGVYLHDFTLANMTSNTIDQNGKHAVFNGKFTDAVAGQTGHITIDNSGTGGSVTFNGDNSHTGSTTLKGGRLLVSKDANLGDTAAQLIFDGGALHATQSFDSTRNVSVNSTGTIHVNTNNEVKLTGEVSGTGSWDKEGAGTLVLDGVNSHSGTTQVNAGKLVIGSSKENSTAQVAGDVKVANSVLKGHGRVNGVVTVNNGGVIAPGTSIGQMHVGQLIFKSGSTFEFEADTDTSADKIIVDSTLGSGNGSASIEPGAILSILAGAGTWTDGVTYTILTADGGVSGQFDKVKKDLLFLDHSVTYNPNDIQLTLKRNSLPLGGAGGTINQSGTGSGIQSLGPNHPIYKTVVSMNKFQAQNMFDNLSGEIHASLKGAVLSNSDYARKSVNQHLMGKSEGVNSKQIDNGKGLWVSTWAHGGNIKADQNAVKLKNDGWGVLLGADLFANDKTTVGLALGYEQTNVKSQGNRASKADVNTVHVMAYGKTSAGPIDIRGGVGYGWLKADTERNIQVSGLYGQNKAKYNGSQVQVFVEGSHTFEINEKAKITPYANVAYQRVNFDDFHENGGVTSLNVRNSAQSATSSTMGVRGEVSINPNAQLYAHLGWQHHFGSKTPKVNANFIGGMPYVVNGNATDKNSAIVGLGADFQLKPNMNLHIGYEGKFGNQSRDHGAKLLWEMRF